MRILHGLVHFQECDYLPVESQKRERIGLQVERGLRVDVFVACLRDCSEAPLHVLSVEVELCFGDVVVVLLDGPGIIGALLVGDGLGEEVWRASAFGLALCAVLAPCECVFAEAPGALDGDDGDLVAGRHFAGVLGRLVGLVEIQKTFVPS